MHHNKILLLLNTLFLAFVCKGQVAISNPQLIDKIATGMTYIAMNNPEAAENKPFIDIFKNEWKFSNIEFIDYNDIENHISPNNSFLTIGGYVTDVQFVRLYQNGSSKNGINFSNTHIYLELWTIDDKYFEPTKKNKEFGDKYKVTIARLELYTDFPALQDPDLIFQAPYQGDGHIFNWGPGILKNQIQTLHYHLAHKKEKSLYSEVLDTQEIQSLKSETLYVVDYAMLRFNPMTGEQSKNHDPSKIFEKYNFEYRLIPIQELNDKILTQNEPFYYLAYVKSSTDKYITIYNSKTGKIVYSKYTPISYNIKSKDLKTLQKVVANQ